MIINKLNSIFKKKENHNFMKILLVIGIFTLLSNWSATMGREGFGTAFSVLSILLFVLGWILIIIPEPTTTLTGIIMVIVSVILGWGLITQFVESTFGDIGSGLIVSVIVGIIIFVMIIKR